MYLKSQDVHLLAPLIILCLKQVLFYYFKFFDGTHHHSDFFLLCLVWLLSEISTFLCIFNLQPRVDWQLKADTLVCEKAVLEEEKAELVKKNLELAEQLKDAQGKFCYFVNQQFLKIFVFVQVIEKKLSSTKMI